jgi:hypothetical protein
VNVPPDRNTRASPVRRTPDRTVIEEISVDPADHPHPTNCRRECAPLPTPLVKCDSPCSSGPLGTGNEF